MKEKKLAYYDVKVETNVPALLTYRILAESPEQALYVSQQSGASPVAVKYHLARKKNLKATVCDIGGSVIRLIKNFV